MAANSYYHPQEQHQHLLAYASPLSDQFSQPPTPLKPFHLTPQTSYQHVFNNFEKQDDLHSALAEDAHLKRRIRYFRLISRILATLLSIGVLAPMTLTLWKFLSTNDIYRTITHPDGTTTTRTAWAHNSRVWPTWAYFGVALTSTLLNFATLFSYRVSVTRANAVALTSSVFSWVVLGANVVVWGVAAGVYREEKDKGGRSDDLWGWTCSPAARAIQREFAREVDFDRFCDVQSAGWVVGLGQVGVGVLSVVIYVLMWRRRGSKRRVMKGEGM